MNKRIAILYDFDFTLSKDYMQSYGLAQEFGFKDAREFFDACDARTYDNQMDLCLSVLGGTLQLAQEQGKPLTRELLQRCGKDVEYYDGVLEWFDKINKIGKKCGFEIEHYIVSSGIKEIVEGTKIAKYFKRIYSNFYSYRDDVAFWPSQIVNFTSKTQYIYRIRKNALDDLSSLKKINQKMPASQVLDFKNILYIGDSETDIPSFKIVKNSGGFSICVYDKENEKARKLAHKCMIEGRVNCYMPADYTEGSDLFNLIKDYIENIAKIND